MYKKWLRFFDLLEKIITNFAAVMMALMAILITYQVFARYVLHYAPYWTEEVSTTFLMWVSLLGAVGGVWTDTHMDLSMLVVHFPKAVQLWLKVFSDFLIGVFGYYFLIEGIDLVKETMGGTLSSVALPIGYTYLIVPFCGALMICFVLLKAYARIMNFYVWKEEISSPGVSLHG